MKYQRLFTALLLLFVMAPLRAQLSNATIRGVVTDPTGAVLPNATVEVINRGTQEHRQLQTTGEGNFDFAALPPDNYQVRVTAPGFGEWTGDLTLRVAQEAVVNVTLQAAAVASTVEVRDVTPVIDTDDSTISDVKEYARIEALPLQNRNFLNILNFTPGVVSNGFAGQGGGYTRVNGIPGGSMEYLVDGQTASERYTNELQRLPQPIPTIQELKITTANGDAQYSRPGMVEVVTKSGTNQYHAELFELNQNSDLTALTFHQNTVAFNVHNEFGGNFSGPVWIPKLYKGTNKTFFFVDAEGITTRAGAIERYTVPEPNWKQGDFSNYVDYTGNPVTIYDPLTTRYDASTGSYVRTAFPGNVIPANRINPIAQKILNDVPNPNINIPYYQGQNYENPGAANKDDNTLVTAKVDQVLGSNRLSARYTYVDRTNFGVGYLLNPENRLYGGNNGAISFTQLITPTLINEVRAGVQQFHAYRGPQLITPPITETLGLPTLPGTVAWPSFYYDDPWNGYIFDGIDRDNPQDAPGVTKTFADNLSWTRGKHELKFGFFFGNYQVNTYETGQPGGDYNFSGGFTGLQDPVAAKQGIPDQVKTDTGSAIADFLLGYVDIADLNVYPRFYTRQSDYAGYVQDNWRATPRLTINLGLRYEYWTPFADKRNQSSTLDFNTPGEPIVVVAGSSLTSSGIPQDVISAYTSAGLKIETSKQAGLPSTLWNMQKNNWAPRVGLAYQLGKNTVLRGGYGTYYWVMPLVQYHQNTRRNAPFAYSFNSYVDPTDNTAAELEFPVGANYQNQNPAARQLGSTFITPNALSISEGSGWNILPWETNYKTQTAQEYNFTIEHQFPWKLGSRLSYVGTHGSNLVDYDPINVPIPRELAAPGATPAQRRAYPDYASSGTGSMDLMRFIGYSNSNQFQTELRRLFSNGLVLQGSFVWQKTLTTSEGSNNSFGGLEMEPAALTNNASTSQRLRMIYANDSELPAYTLSFNGNYELPFGQGKKYLSGSNSFVRRLVGGWNAAAFYYWRSGLYFSPYYSTRGSAIILAPGKTGILPKDQRQADQWFDGSIDRADLGQPYTGQTFIERANPLDDDFLNNIPRDYMTGPGYYNVDASFYKITTIKERVKLRIEAQVFNLLNHQNFGLPDNTGYINSGISGALPRTVQFQGKIEF